MDYNNKIEYDESIPQNLEEKHNYLKEELNQTINKLKNTYLDMIKYRDKLIKELNYKKTDYWDSKL